jgi:hypothetical protein
MKIVGRVQLTMEQSNVLTAGGTTDLPLAQFREFVPGRARIGDLVWVQEPFFAFVPKRWQYDTVYRPGPMSRSWGNPPVKRPAPPGESNVDQGAARFLARKNSSTTLEIMGFAGCGGCVRCLVIPKNVDAITREKSAA